VVHYGIVRRDITVNSLTAIEFVAVNATKSVAAIAFILNPFISSALE
jgi:hypothetical protein